MKKTLFAFKNRSVIAYGVLAVGVFGAILVNCGFLRALIAFFVGVIFCAVAGLCMAYFARSALHQLDTDVLEDEAVRAARLQVFNTSKRFLQVELLCFAGVLLPLIAFVQSAYQGLHYDSVLGECAVFVLVAQLVFFGVCEPLVWRKAAHCGAGVPEENPMKTLLQRAHWRVRASALCACLCVVLGAAHIVYLEMGATMFIEPLLFYDEETFVDFMGEQGEEEQALSFDESIAYGSATLPDICEINAPDGTVLFTYVARNTDVTNVSYGFVGDEIDPFPIRVTLDSMLTSARAKHVKGNLVYVMLYPCMVGLSALYYLCVRKREVPPPESV